MSVKQGDIKYHFLSLWYDSTWNWTPVSRTIGEIKKKSICLIKNPNLLYKSDRLSRIITLSMWMTSFFFFLGLLGCYRYSGFIEELRGYQSLSIPVTDDFSKCIKHCAKHHYQFAGIVIRSVTIRNLLQTIFLRKSITKNFNKKMHCKRFCYKNSWEMILL